MTTAEWITASLVLIIAAILAVVSIRSFQNKGFLFNNAYIYASKKERGKMDKKPYYRQSAIVFLISSISVDSELMVTTFAPLMRTLPTSQMVVLTI